MPPGRRMLFRLALAVGEWDVRALSRRMPASLYREWLDFFGVEPWGFEQDWLRTGTVAATVVAANPYRSRDAKVPRPADYVPRAEGDPAAKPPADPPQVPHPLGLAALGAMLGIPCYVDGRRATPAEVLGV